MTSPNNLDEEFRGYLAAKADGLGIKGGKRAGWIDYMSNAGRGTALSQQMLGWLKLTPPAPLSVLDVGCGFGNALVGLSKDFATTAGLDIEHDRVRWTSLRVPSADVQQGSVTSMPWSDNSFDLVVSTDVFEHVDRDQQQAGAREIARVLKPGGHAFVAVPNLFQVMDEHNRVLFGTWLPSDLRRRYVERFSSAGAYVECWERSPKTWTRVFEQAGFTARTEVTKPRGIRVLPASRVHLYLVKPTS